MAEPLNISDGTFEKEVLKSDTPVLVDFWATWCGPCRAIAPAIKQIAAEYDGQLKVVKLDIDHNPQTPGRYGVMSIPTLMVFKGGSLVERWTGSSGKDAILQRVNKHLTTKEVTKPTSSI